METEARDKIVQARANLILDEPFFGALALRLGLRPDPMCKTFWTDGQSLGFNPEYAVSLSVVEIQAVVCHEVLHNACGHPWRRGGRDPQKWNVAADYAINPIVVDAGMRLPDGVLLDPGYRGYAVEQIYPLLSDSLSPEEQGQDQGQDGAGSPGGGQTGQPSPQEGKDFGCGEVRDAPIGDAEALEAEWHVATIQAAQAARAQGKLPAGLERIVDEIRRPKVDWKAALRRFVQQAATEDYSWQYPDPRYVAAGLYLPAVRSERMPSIGVAVDTSGS